MALAKALAPEIVRGKILPVFLCCHRFTTHHPRTAICCGGTGSSLGTDKPTGS